MRSETTSAGVTEKKLFLFRTYDHDKDPEGIPYRPRLRRQNTPDPNMIRRPTTINYGVAESLCVWQVARAATAAPFFFSTIKFQRHTLEGVRTEHFSDGGFGPQNNPTMEGIREIETMYGNGRVGAIVNVGTSRDPSLDGNGTMTRIKGTFDAATDPRIVADEVRRRQIAWRFNDDGGIGVAMDEWKPSGRFVKAPGRKTLGKIRIEFHRWASESANHKSISACARELVKRRRRRIEDKGRWEVFATGAFFGCGIAGCLDAPFPSAEDLREHYIRSHGFGDGEVDAVVERGTKKWRYQSNSHLHGT